MYAHVYSIHHPSHLPRDISSRVALLVLLFLCRMVPQGGEAVGERGDGGSELSARDGSVPRPVAALPDQGARQAGGLEAGELETESRQHQLSWFDEAWHIREASAPFLALRLFVSTCLKNPFVFAGIFTVILVSCCEKRTHMCITSRVVCILPCVCVCSANTNKLTRTFCFFVKQTRPKRPPTNR